MITGEWLLEQLKKLVKQPPLRQCVQCGALEGTIFCDRFRTSEALSLLGPCRFVEIRPCEKCGNNSLCFGDTGNGNCPLGERIERNRRGCKDQIAKRKEGQE